MQFAFPSNSPQLFLAIAVTVIGGFALMFFLSNAPVRARRPIIVTFTFLAGLFFMLETFWPRAQGYTKGEVPQNFVEQVSFFIADGTGQVGLFATILSSFLLGLGVFSLLRIHVGRLVKQQKDWFFSLVLLISMVVMCFVGYWSWYGESFVAKGLPAGETVAWVETAKQTKDFIFDGMLQKMDGAMFSIIAFYIMSAAYRAFRIRSVEATILLAAALIVMLSLLAVVDLVSSGAINAMTNNDPNHFLQNFTVSEVAGFIRTAFQSPSIRAIDFGIGVGTLAMGLRLWLSLDRGGVTGS